MDIIKVGAFSFAVLFILMFFRGKRDDIAVQVSIGAGIIIFLFMAGKIAAVLQFLQQLSNKANIDFIYLNTVFKILGIAYVSSFCSEICKDAGEGSLGAKVDFAGKIFILVLAIPILMAVLQSILKIM